MACRSVRSRRALALLGIALLAGTGGLVGCGGGSSGGVIPGGGGGGGGNTSSEVSGRVTDITGAPIVGATVKIGSLSATTTQFGNYVLPGVPAGVFTITASLPINNITWTGQNTVEVVSGDVTTPNTHIVLSDPATQGSLSGTVLDAQGRSLVGAKVFAATLDPGGTFFTTQSAIHTVTDQNGNYLLPKLPNHNYTVTASLAGYLNQTVTAAVASGGQSQASFTLNTTSAPSTVPLIKNLSAFSITMPLDPTRAAGQTANAHAMNALRYAILQARGALKHHAAEATRITLRTARTRSTPSGAIIESELLWDFQPLNNLFGYSINRSTNGANFLEIALVRDPLTDRFTDSDIVLTPDTTYYYDVALVDTINFPKDGTQGPVDSKDIVAVAPFAPLALIGPTEGALVTGSPTFSWTAVSRATKYKVMLYDRFPDYQSDTDPNGVPPIWSLQVNAPATQLTYNGTGLTLNHTYFWAVIASDDPNATFGISSIRSFVAR